MDGASLTATPPGRDTSRELPLCCRCHDSSTAARGFREFLAPIVLMLQVQSMSTERHRLEQPRLLAYMQRHQARGITEGWSRNRVVVPRVNRGDNGHWCGCVQSWMERQAGTSALWLKILNHASHPGGVVPHVGDECTVSKVQLCPSVWHAEQFGLASQ